MKKVILGFLAIVLMISLTGCGNKKITCTNESGSSKEEAIIEYKDTSIKKLTYTVKEKSDSEYLDQLIEATKEYVDTYNKVNGMTMSVSKENNEYLVLKMIYDFNKIDINQAKSVLGDDYDEHEDLFETKNKKLDDVKKSLEDEGYTCK